MREIAAEDGEGFDGMSGDLSRPRMAQIKLILSSAIRFEIRDVDVEDTCRRFGAEGYEVTPWLREFVENYSGLSVVWRGARGNENELTTETDSALEVYPGNIRVCSRRLGSRYAPEIADVVVSRRHRSGGVCVDASLLVGGRNCGCDKWSGVDVCAVAARA